MKLSTRLASICTVITLALSICIQTTSAQESGMPQQPIGGGGGDCCYAESQSSLSARVLVVYNGNVPESIDVANYYASRRSIPSANLLDIYPSSDTEISYAEFTSSSIKTRIKNKLNALGRGNILYIVFSYRTPYRIPDVPIATVTFGCPSNDPRCQYGTSLDQFVADIWDQTGLWRSDTIPQSGNAYYTISQSKVNQYQPFISLADFRNQNPTSTTYSVWRLDGPTADIAKGLVDKAVAVETGTDGLLGYGYFDKDTGSMYQNPDDSGATLRGDWDIYRAAEFAREAGFPVTEDNHQQVFGTAPAPTSASDAALYAGTYNLGQYNDAFTWRTGAIGFDFNSDAAQGFRNGTKWCGGALLKGIAVTGGAIDEPYAPLIPKYDGVFKNIFEGANVGDALARNTPALKWKLINIGDPLYQPTLGRYMPAALNPLPYPWSFVDINANPGGANLIKNTAKVIAVGDLPSFEVRSYGLTLYGNSDSCNFTYMPLDGDGSVTVRVGRTEAIDYHAVAGVTFRESTAPDSRNIAVMIDGEGQLQTRIRTVPGQDSALTTIGGENENPYPIWLQIYRSGNTFHGYKSTDGYNWTEIINQTISLPSTALVGLVTVSGNASVPNKAFYDNVVVQGQFYCGGGVPIPKH